MKRLGLLLAILLLTGIARDASGSLQISANGRYLVDGDGRPFLMTGDSAWSLIAGPTLPEAKLYLQDRADRGFNFVAVNLIEHSFTANPPQNANGDAPFTGAPFATPNEAYFAHADSVVGFAASLGIVLYLSPVYLGYRCGSQGWCEEIQAASLADMREWGRYVGARYGGFGNILWSIGGDADPAPVKDELREFVAGLREFDTTSLISAHNHRDTQAVTYWPTESWLQVNNVFALRTALYQSTTAGYEYDPVMPFFLLEGFYENEHGATNQQLRAQSYWTVLTGGMGVVFGNCPLWHFGYSSTWCGLTDWMVELPHPGSVQMTHYRALFESRRWWHLVPDLDDTVLIGGQGTDGAEDYATAAAASDGSSIVAYAPTPRSMTFDTSSLTGETVRVWWFDPADGSAGTIGDYATGTIVVPPWSSGDRVIVLDDVDQGFAEPGSPLATASPASRPGPGLDQNRPNPFNPGTEIRYRLATGSRVHISIFDVSGRRVRDLLDARQPAGPHRTRWDGNDDAGRPMASGVYYYRLVTDDGSATRKMVLIR